MFGNGLLLMTIVALSYPTALVGEYLNTRPARPRSRRMAWSCWHVRRMEHLPASAPAGARAAEAGRAAQLIASARRRVALGFMIYVVATGLALVNAYLGLGIITAMWGFWAVIAYRALNGRERLSADASSREDDVDSE